MKVTKYTAKSGEVVISDDLSMNILHWTDAPIEFEYKVGRTTYKLELPDFKLLNTSKTILKRLSNISGIEYRVAAIVDGKVVKWF